MVRAFSICWSLAVGGIALVIADFNLLGYELWGIIVICTISSAFGMVTGIDIEKKRIQRILEHVEEGYTRYE